MRSMMTLLALAIWTSVGFAAAPLHSEFDQILSAHLSDTGVNYPGIAGDRRFENYLRTLDETHADDLASREERLAYWINAYNAFAIKGILDGYSPSSFFGRIGYFKSKKFRLGGAEIDLYDLERDVLIPEGEPRIHFAINCASMSCPALRAEVYTAADLDQQLEEGARKFINDSSRNRFDRENKVAYLSQIFDWFDEDFSNHSGTVLAYVARYVDDRGLAKELEANDYTIEYLEYDWNLNGTPPEG